MSQLCANARFFINLGNSHSIAKTSVGLKDIALNKEIVEYKYKGPKVKKTSAANEWSVKSFNLGLSRIRFQSPFSNCLPRMWLKSNYYSSIEKKYNPNGFMQLRKTRKYPGSRSQKWFTSMKKVDRDRYFSRREAAIYLCLTYALIFRGGDIGRSEQKKHLIRNNCNIKEVCI